MQNRSASEKALSDLIADGGFAIALSGGGHRATLATLGALMAVVDRGLGPKIIQVASVSGGSITNAYVAQRCRLEKLGPGELDDVAAELAATIIRKGVLTKRWIALPLVLALVAGGVFRYLITPSNNAAIAVGIVTLLVTLILSGQIVEWLLDRRYFRRNDTPGKRSSGSRARLASLSGTQVDHVLCMTDLVLGLPVYASSQHGGMMWRRLQLKVSQLSHPSIQTFDIGQLSIATLVRASAAFPGIPPLRLRMPDDPQIESVAESPRLAFLADGGLWNNLGTHVIREDGFIGSHSVWDRGVLRPYGPAPRNIPLLCFNGSAPHQPSRTWMLQIPGVALLKSLLQATMILNTNTVLPRVDAMKLAFERRSLNGTAPSYLDPADLLVDLREVEDIKDDYRIGTWGDDEIRKADPNIRSWERDVLMRLRLTRDSSSSESDADWLPYVLGPQPEPKGSYPVVGLANFDDWEALRLSPDWAKANMSEAHGRVDAPTTLGRIESSLARRLIARAYLNTYLVSIFLKPLAEGELQQLARFSERLDHIMGAAGAGR